MRNNPFSKSIIEAVKNPCSVIMVDSAPKASEELHLESEISSAWRSEGRVVHIFNPYIDKMPWVKTEESSSFNPLLALQTRQSQHSGSVFKHYYMVAQQSADSLADPMFPDIVSDSPMLPPQPDSFHNFLQSDSPNSEIEIQQIVDAFYRITSTLPAVATNSLDTMHMFYLEKELFKGLLHAALLRNHTDFPMIFEAVSRSVSDCISFLNASCFLSNSFNTQLDWFLRNDSTLHASRKAELLVSISRRMAIFLHPGVKEKSVKNDIALDSFLKEPTLIIVRSPRNIPGANLIPSIMIRLLMVKAMERYRLHSDCTVETKFYLDDVENLFIPGFDQFRKLVQGKGVDIIEGRSMETAEGGGNDRI